MTFRLSIDRAADGTSQSGCPPADGGAQCRLRRRPYVAGGLSLLDREFPHAPRFLTLTLVFASLLPLRVLAEPLPGVEADRVGLAAAPLADIDALMQSYVKDDKLAGIVMLIARDGKVAHVGTYGKMDIEANQPMRRDAIFRIYSMTKPITGAALMTLFDEGRFALDDPVAKYLPGFDKVKVFAGTDGGTTKLVDLNGRSRFAT